MKGFSCDAFACACIGLFDQPYKLVKKTLAPIASDLREQYLDVKEALKKNKIEEIDRCKDLILDIAFEYCCEMSANPDKNPVPKDVTTQNLMRRFRKYCEACPNFDGKSGRQVRESVRSLIARNKVSPSVVEFFVDAVLDYCDVRMDLEPELWPGMLSAATTQEKGPCATTRVLVDKTESDAVRGSGDRNMEKYVTRLLKLVVNKK